MQICLNSVLCLSEVFVTDYVCSSMIIICTADERYVESDAKPSAQRLTIIFDALHEKNN